MSRTARRATPDRPWWAAALALTLLTATISAQSAPCPVEDFETHVNGSGQCLLMRRFGPVQPETMVVWLHGDVGAGGPANYHFARARVAAERFASARILSVALVRPVYPDGSGESSGVSLLDGGRADHYTRDNLSEVGAAIAHLREHFKPARVVAVGHSGGAATTAVLLGMSPGLIDGAVLVSCPCDLAAWRVGRRRWARSEDPLKWSGKVDTSARVIALTGSKDDNTSPDLARTYVDALRARGVDATIVVLPEETHDGAFRAPDVLDALARLLPTP